IGSLDTTITGSRSGFSPLMLWYRLQQLGEAGLRERLARSLANAAYLLERLQEIGVPAWRNPNAITVVLPRVAPEIQRRWQLATAGDISHVLVLPNVGRDQIDAFVAELATSRKEDACKA
ncbi:MAG: histidine decarboxylase, partial [Candidatus Baltobacteraceae bacterium]